MSLLEIEESDDTPKVLIDGDKGTFYMGGKLYPEDVIKFFDPILTWLKKFNSQEGKTLDVVFKFEYFNTASTKKIFEILVYFSEIQKKGTSLKIKWMHKFDDEDMLNAGKKFSKMMPNLAFEFEKF